MYLEIGTWQRAELTDHWIAGPLADLFQLATLIEERVMSAVVGERLALQSDFSPSFEYELTLEVRHEPFDPAQADSACW
jgi:hypothetical protein